MKAFREKGECVFLFATLFLQVQISHLSQGTLWPRHESDVWSFLCCFTLSLFPRDTPQRPADTSTRANVAETQTILGTVSTLPCGHCPIKIHTNLTRTLTALKFLDGPSRPTGARFYGNVQMSCGRRQFVGLFETPSCAMLPTVPSKYTGRVQFQFQEY